MKISNLRRCLVALVGVLACCPLAQAATYYSDPVAGTAQGDGSAAAPWPKLETMTKAGLLPQLHDGDTLLLRSGNHGNARFSGDHAATVTIAAQPGQTPQLGRLELRQGANWLLRGLTISPAFSAVSYASPHSANIVTLGEGGPTHDVVLEDCFVYTASDSRQWSKDDWLKAFSGVFLGRNATKMTMRNNYILNTRFGVTLGAPDSLCEGNVIANFSGDGLRITRDDITVRDNVIRNSYLGAADGDLNHDDLIQCFLFNKGTGTVNRATVTGNVLIGIDAPEQPFQNSPQGLGFFDGPLVDFDIENNVVLSNIWHGISLYDAVNCKITGNMVNAVSTQRMMPWIMLGTKNKGGASGNTVQNNRACAFNLKADSTLNANNNLPVDKTVFLRRLREQAQIINAKFGAIHPVAKLPRLYLDKGIFKAPLP